MQYTAQPHHEFLVGNFVRLPASVPLISNLIQFFIQMLVYCTVYSKYIVTRIVRSASQVISGSVCSVGYVRFGSNSMVKVCTPVDCRVSLVVLQSFGVIAMLIADTHSQFFFKTGNQPIVTLYDVTPVRVIFTIHDALGIFRDKMVQGENSHHVHQVLFHKVMRKDRM